MYLAVISQTYGVHVYWVIVIGMHNHFTISDEINITCTVPYTEVLKNQ